ncbi:hypothetical protein H2198_002511 [Neophaeococcomyces mojaviensis]|uniref:Uncharacterized protein n=1 Tax=Neophaeococcomyces mojaviensis TaxID=3383035 RepID=A0ACC3AE15_9EURO|nr:hypothetical protein H2198_002511 [Knufia sp. JES_112]
MNAERAIKRRATRACQSCRSRKVRCDILVNGVRCTNCKLDNVDCLLLGSRRGKGNNKSLRESHESPAESTPSSNRDTNTVPTEYVDNECLGRVYLSPRSTTANGDDVPVCLTFDDEEVRDTIDDRTEQGNRAEIPEIQNATSTGSGARSALSNDCAVSSPQSLHLPLFIKPLPKSMDGEDIDYLQRKGGFIIPQAELRNEIIRSYITSVHPFMPILDLREFLDAACNEESTGRISLLLFQAVMFAGLASLKEDIIQQTNCDSLKQARTVFFNRVRLLYDFEIEPDNTNVLQSLLLMSFAYEKWNDQKHTWHWTGLALSLAQNMGLHRETHGPDIPQKLQHLQRRLWWSLYIRDRLIGLGTRRPVRIRDDEYDVPMLTLQDFDIEPLDMPFTMSHHEIPVPQEVSQNRCLALMCIELAKLCIYIGHMLASQYTTLGERSQLTRNMMVAPKQPLERAQGLLTCDKELTEWYQTLDPQLRTLAHQSDRGALSNCQEIQWSILHMIYQTSIIVLHRPQVLQPCVDGAEVAQMQKSSREKVKDAARMITKITRSMLRRDKVRFLPTSGVPALLSASLGHMLDIKSKDEDVRDASIFRFYQNMQVLQRLRTVYASADSAVSFLALAIRKAGINVPIPLASQPIPTTMFETQSTHQPFLAPSTQTSRKALGLSTQNPRFNSMNSLSQERQASLFNESTNGLRLVQPDNLQHSQRLGQHTRDLHNAMTFQTHAGLSNLDASMDANLPCDVYSASIATSLEQGQSYASGDIAMQDPLPLWIVGGDFFNTNSSLDHDISQEPIAPSYDFCSDAFGLLDAFDRDNEDSNTIVVDRSNAF